MDEPQKKPCISAAHAYSIKNVCDDLDTSPGGLSHDESRKRRLSWGDNRLPRTSVPGLGYILFRQFLSPLIYILLAAAIVSLYLGEITDAAFIGAVLFFNAFIGAYQEYRAQRQAEALQALVHVRTRVLHEGEAYEVDSRELVPGDIVLLESGDKVPADIRLMQEQGLDVDESLLTGESTPSIKDAAIVLPADTAVADRANMVFAGTLVTRGRANGVVTATGSDTELGAIAHEAVEISGVKAPLLVRMARFTTWIAVSYVCVIGIIAVVASVQGASLYQMFLIAVALAVAAIPEGLPVAITVALSVGAARMARHKVIIRRLVAAESLGSCTFLAVDKTGTLTLNELTAQIVKLPQQADISISGIGMEPEGTIENAKANEQSLRQLARAAVLCNEGFLGRRDGRWVYHGDMVDVALLVLAHKAGLKQAEVQKQYPQRSMIAFESERMYAATLSEDGDNALISVKGAVERVLGMCTTMVQPQGATPIDRSLLQDEADALAEQGYRVLALAQGTGPRPISAALGERDLHDLCFLGLVAMIDPPREQAKSAIEQCRQAGIEVAMLTGDHPITALAIARKLGLASSIGQVVSGKQFKACVAMGQAAVDKLVEQARVFARVDPEDKLEIIKSLERAGHYVAVTGDGANDAPALHAAHVGVAMGKKGTDVARESAEIIIGDDDISSIVSGIREGRVAYANVRKVIFLLISTGAVELALFMLCLAASLPMPLLAVQLLWLNLVTEGIQHVGLAFEPAEGDEMARAPRRPTEPVFNRVMIERVLLSAMVMGALAYMIFSWMLSAGESVDSARNLTLLALVLFENVQVLNSRSEERSIFSTNILSNRLLLWGTVGAQLVHIGAMYTPGLNDLLGVQPVSFDQWLSMLAIVLIVVITIELHKLVYRRRLKAG